LSVFNDYFFSSLFERNIELNITMIIFFQVYLKEILN